MYKDLKHVKLGNMDFYNGDNMELLRQTPDKFYDVSLVDPPYGLGQSVVNSGGRFARYENKKGNWDNEIPSEEYFKELFRVSKNQIIWGGNYFLDYLQSTKCFLIWDKRQPENVSFASCELAWTSFNSVAKTFYLRPQNQEDRFHPTQKPVALYEWILNNYVKPNDKILDTHLGSGSIALACHKLNFNLTAIELDEEYFNKAMERIENVTKFKTNNDLF